jgi:hypothetical protein
MMAKIVRNERGRKDINFAYLISEQFVLLKNRVEVFFQGLKLGFPLLSEPLGANSVLDEPK